MSSVQQKNEHVASDDIGLAHAELGTNQEAPSSTLDFERLGNHSLEVENLRVLDNVINNPEPAATIEPPHTVKEGRLRVAKTHPQKTSVVIEKTIPLLKEELPLQNQVSTTVEPTYKSPYAETIALEAPAIPAHLLEKLNLQNTQPQSELATNQPIAPETLSDVSIEEAKLLQAERTGLTAEQAIKLDLSFAKIGTGQTIKPLSFRGHSLGSGTMLDRLITAMANFIKRLEMRFLSFLTRKRLERKALKAKPIKVVLPTEEDESLRSASFSNSLARSRKKRNRWFGRFTLDR